MREKDAATAGHSGPGHYEIRIKGHLAERWAGWFEGLTIALADNGDTVLTGAMIDQAALHGYLRKIRDLGMPLVSVTGLNPGPVDVLGVQE